MKRHYLCPHCRSYLRVRENIILTFKSDQSDKQGIILLNPDLGNYGFIVHNTIEFENKEKTTFYCPVCFKSVTADKIDENLATILMIDEDKKEFDIYFSRIAGEQLTFKIEKFNIIEKFGKDSSSYYNYFSSKLKQHMKE